MANTSPTNWFLADAAISPFRTPAFTSGNEVTALVDGKAYMDHLAARFSAPMTAGDYYFFTAWRATGTMKLQPDSSAKTYLQWIQDLRASNVDVRGMLWYVPSSSLDSMGVAIGQASENIAMVNGVNAAGGRAVLDHRVPSYIAAHHQKTAVLSSGGSHWAYVGGIDVCLDRWDTPAHADPALRPKEAFAGWHDVHSAIRGPAVAQVWENFRQRWNDPTAPHTSSGVPGGAVPAAITATKPAPPSSGNQNVQLLRTLACRSTYSFLTGGEQTVRLAYEKAIDKAEHYIYIEDQYLWPCTLANKLNAAAKRGVKVIFVTAHEYDMLPLRLNHNDLRHDGFLAAVRKGTAAPNVFVFHLQRPSNGADIYVHSKVMIVDDCYAAIGSANIGRRSHTSDSELHIAVVDGTTTAGHMNGTAVTVCQFAKNLRVALWSEHLGLSASSVDDPIASLASWPTGTGQVHHAVVHQTPPWYLRSPCAAATLISKKYGCAAAQMISAAMNLRTTC